MKEYACKVKDQGGDKVNVLAYADDVETVVNILVREKWVDSLISIKPTGEISLLDKPYWKYVSLR